MNDVDVDKATCEAWERVEAALRAAMTDTADPVLASWARGVADPTAMFRAVAAEVLRSRRLPVDPSE